MMKLKFLLLLLAVVLSAEEERPSRQTYIVHMDKSGKPTAFPDHSEWYDSCLRSVSASSASTLYKYNTVVHGFSSQLTVKEARSLEKLPGILAILPETIYRLHTTRTPEFLKLIRHAAAGEDGFTTPQTSTKVVVVGVLDTGVWPELKSFDDAGLGPVPRSWRGSCEGGTMFNSTSCNGKVIGARFFSRGYEAFYGPIDENVESKSPRDDDGHGSHTSTTVAGSVVPDASLFGFASGSARGMAPQARLAIYKVCWKGGCFGSDILAAMDRAVEDGVDIISMSIGGGVANYHSDVIAIGAFGATARGVFVSCSAGNEGPTSRTVANVAPWITTVGAGTLDRDFPTYVTLGNGKKYVGVSLYNGRGLSRNSSINSVMGGFCYRGSLTPSAVKGKIVICNRGENPRAEKGMVVKDAGGVGMILVNMANYGEELVADAHLLPSAAVGFKAGEEIKKYVVSDPNPTATIARGGTRLGVKPSPVVAAFSSRGPNPLTPQILKPDLIAPGVNILAGWTGAAGPTGLDNDKRRVNFNIVSGTSMSCPHVSGLAALLKGTHPNWSPAAIRSALMTTAYSTYKDSETIKDLATGDPSTPFHYGSGHVNPVSAADPGLVYDTSEEDYLGFLCALNYTSAQIKTVAKKDFACDPNKTYRVSDLNYPSFAVTFETALSTGEGGIGALSTVTYKRTVTNVGGAGTYVVSLSSGSRLVRMSVEPGKLSFGKLYEKKSYAVTFVASSMPSGTTSFGSLEWSDGEHKVRSPIAFSWT